ncbi:MULTISPECIES: DUF1289 domain-containing protein [Burkholderia]|uniref:DUF1289 domain-containing protein n=1 Tax=Burkholderia TaxID=32008 RepID=UPI00075387BF|nr:MULTISPECIES: DUF1289 domain-containing protein [Burkholderia]AOJ70238.1 hypothetical protein WS78_16790 [Burkholderia savannae]KVG38835.1 hypothetical protein WS77_01690 [Burkholderia sp. MSMB0265]KVG82155.1 hypothetical protein WS81_10770 [Burkholderia sp. MSMB2040]KVG91447.1 hypothetical protein WS82_15125 [Burkholderia sp. MSMB2041]KVG98317.1 hypothetical protein WS83_29705 [Burkholderia sp. MSMB2042]
MSGVTKIDGAARFDDAPGAAGGGDRPHGVSGGDGSAAAASMATTAPVASVPSPCTNVCRIDARTGWCEGCRRTRDEIAGWRKFDDDAKRAVLARLAARRTASA